MAEPNTSPGQGGTAAPQSPPPPEKKPAPPPRERPVAKRKEFNPLRPLHYSYRFLKGTTVGFLDGLAAGGRRGMWFGLGVGLIVGIATGGVGIAAGVVGTAFAGGLAGFIGGAGLAGLVGLVRGGMREVKLAQRKEKYADDLARRAEARAGREQRRDLALGYDYRDQHARSRAVQRFNFDRTQQQIRENERDYGGGSGSLWGDRVESGSGLGMGR